MRTTIIIIIGAVVVIAGVYLLYGYFYPTDLGTRTVSVVVEEGDSFNGVARRLTEEGLVPSEFVLKLAARSRKIDRKLIPGRYDFSGRNSAKTILDRLEAGDFLRLRLTIYEGAPIWTVASIMQSVLEVDSAHVVALNTDTAFCHALGVPYLEGYLFPETYFIPWGTTAEEVITDMVAMFKRQTDGVWPIKIPNDLSREQVITLASIIEAEAFLDTEKPTIASVYHNRLRKGWRLDADPTVIYGLGGLDRPLYRRDLRKMTPYNTYRHQGLPPTPINSPGLASIKAALYPTDTDYFFFVADGSGGHRFTRTNAEHNKARREIKQNSRRATDQQSETR